MNPAPLNTPLWDFSLGLYRQPGVEALCLSLQDDWGADVNLLLWLCWLEQEGLVLNETRLHLADASIAPWRRDVIVPLRRVRQHIKREYGTQDSTVEASRQAIKSAELKAEQAVQERLEKLALTWLDNDQRAPVEPGANLSVYARLLALPHAKEQEARRLLLPGR
ncbi:TIGR02444 family protein [Marinimicrobium locisalis]|uniref:TIGR02444 family protein n=1 Tax=Marinimicrobium locisalis TaxID=546022 RepID=UPI003221801D